MAEDIKQEIHLSAEDERNSLPLADELPLVEEALKIDSKTEDNDLDIIDNKKEDITPEFSNADNNDNPDADADLDNAEGDSSDNDSSADSDTDVDDPINNNDNNEVDNKKKKKSKSQKRIEKLARDKNYWKDRAINAEANTQAITPDTKPEKKESSKLPVVDDFEDYEDYQKALIAHHVKDALSEQNSNITVTSERNRKNIQLEDHLERGSKKYEDFEEVISDETLPITQDILDIMVDSDNMSDILYHLANNPDELSKLSKQSKIKQTLAIGRLDNRFSVKTTKKKITKAKAPIKSVKSSLSPAKSLSDMSYDDYRKHRLEQQKKR